MKRKFSKIMSLLLAVVMLMSLIQLPALAATKPDYRDPSAFQNKPGTTSTRQHRSWIAPYGDEVSHFDYYATDGDKLVEYYMYLETEAMHLDPDGIMVMNSKFADSTETGNRVCVSSDYGDTNQPSGNITQYANAPFIFNFDDPFCYSDAATTIHSGDSDTSSVIFKNVVPVTDPETDNKYIVANHPSGKNLISIPNHWCRPNVDDGAMNSFIITADILLKNDEDFVFHFRYGAIPATGSDFRKIDYLTWNHTTGMLTDRDGNTFGPFEPGWHNFKIMYSCNMKAADNPNPYRYETMMYTLFFDNDLITPLRATDYSYQTYVASSRPNNLFEFQGTGGLDNFKLYGSSTPHAYNVGVASTPMSGGTVAGSSSMACVVDYTNAETHYIYSYYVSDTADSAGNYTKVTSTNTRAPLYITTDGKLAINSDCEGRYLKVGARVWNRGGMSPEVMSKQVYEIQGYETTHVTPGTASKDARFRLTTPVAGEKELIKWSFLTAPEGVTLTEDGLFSVTSDASGVGVYKVMNTETGESSVKNLAFVPNVTTYGTELDEVIEPVVFKADINLNDTTTINAGSKTFAVDANSIGGVACSDGATFKFVVEDDIYYAFVDHEFIGSDGFAEDIKSITIDGTVENYYAGSPLVTDGEFITYVISEAYDSNWIKTPVYEFYNESGVYPASYDFKWYINDEFASNNDTFTIPGGSVNKSIYCDITGVTDNAVTRRTNSLTINSQYNLSVGAPGEFTVSLNTADKEVYVFFVGDDKSVFVADMSDGEDVTANLNGNVNYNMIFVRKADLSARGVATRILTNTTYSDTLLPAGALPNLVILARNANTTVASDGASLFEDPAAYDEIINILPVDGAQTMVSEFIGDVYVTSETATTYADFENQPEGLYNIISIDDSGFVTETESYNKLYKLFADPANYNYYNFRYITQKALALSDEEADALVNQISEISDPSKIAPLMGTKAEYFPASVFFQSLSELSAPSDAALASLESHLEKVELPTDVVNVMVLSAFYADEMQTINHADGLEAATAKLAEHMILTEVACSYNSTNIRRVLDLIGSDKFNNATKEGQIYAAGVVAKKTFASFDALKTAVDNAIDKFVPVKPDTNEKDKGSSGGSFGGSTSITITGTVTPPVEETKPEDSKEEEPKEDPKPATPSFSDTPNSHWAFDYVEKMAKAGVLNGYGDGFRPDNNITRAEFVKVLCTAFDIKAEGDVAFDDVSKDSWYAPYVSTLAAAGIAKGADGKFRPDEQISRQDAAVLLQRVLEHAGYKLESGELSFTDANAMSDYAKDAISSLVKAGIINGMEDGSYAPTKNITRAQVAKLICVAIELGGDK